MRKRMLPRAMMFMAVLMTAVLLGCGLLSDNEQAAEESAGTIASVPVSYSGPTSLEERILASPVIARVRLDSVTSTVEPGTTYQGLKYLATLEFSFSVLEYLKGIGADDIVAVWAAPFFDTQQEAEAALPALAAARDTQWDSREAIVFLQHSVSYLPSTQQAGRFFLSGVHEVASVPDDYYSLASRGNKLWLPAAAAEQASSDQQRFLLDVPPATGTAPTITLGELKTRIVGVAAKVAAGDGSEEYMECVRRTYQYEGDNQYDVETGGDGIFFRRPDHELGSGLAASSVVYEAMAYASLQNVRAEIWLDGGDAGLFGVEFSDGVPSDFSGDGETDSILYAQQVMTARPLPAGAYRFHYNDREAHFVFCDGWTVRYEWTVTVTPPEGTLHEMFFDPDTDGTAVAADSSNGVLKPTAFTGVDGGSATVQRIAYEAGAVTLEVTPDGALAGQVVDVIELEGSVSLSLAAADADAGDGGLRWPVASQPWEDGDTLMVRIRQAAE